MKKVFQWVAVIGVVLAGLHLADVYTPAEVLSILRAEVARKNGDYETAIEAYDRALSTMPDDVDLLNNRGVSKADLAQYEAAIAD